MMNNKVIGGYFGDIDAHAAKKDFPMLARNINGRKIVYLDNASTTQKPASVIKEVEEFLSTRNANVHRGMYGLAEEATQAFEDARNSVAGLINANAREIVFTRGTTEGINLLAYEITSLLDDSRDRILVTELEHHSNLVPWQELAKRTGFKLEIARIKTDFTIDEADLRKKLGAKTAIFAFTAASNTTGTLVDCKEYCKLARIAGAVSVVDAAQLVPHKQVDVKDMGCDFLVFSSHKMLGPSGIGALYGRHELLEKLTPYNYGGSMISQVTYESASFAQAPGKFEAGTPNIEGAVGFGEAAKCLMQIGLDRVSSWEEELLKQALDKLKSLDGVEIYHPGKGKGIAVVSFNIKGLHPHDVASLLDDFGICVRAGHHCTMPLMEKLKVPGTLRASFSFYNTFEDVGKLIDGLAQVTALLGVNPSRKAPESKGNRLQSIKQ